MTEDEIDDFLAGQLYDIDGNSISFREWAEIRERAPESVRVARTEIDDVTVSTVHLGLDHSFGFGGPPMIFETLVIGTELDGEMYRYSTREEAEEGHERIVELVRLEIAARSESADHREDHRDDNEHLDADRKRNDRP